MSNSTSPRSIAELRADDQPAEQLGIAVVESSSAQVVLSLTVTEPMLNPFGTCHGGVLFHLADTAMSYVSNADQSVSFATGASIDFLSPAKLGDTLTATITTTVPGRSAIHDAVVTRQDGTIVAAFRGNTRQPRQ